MYFRLLGTDKEHKIVGLNVYNSDGIIVKQFGRLDFEGVCKELDYVFQHRDNDEFFAKLDILTEKLGLVEL